MNLITAFFILLFSVSSLGQDYQDFETSFVKLKLPPSWKCQSQNQEWMCMDSRAKSGYAMIILSAKQRAPSESIAGFHSFLSKPIQSKNSSKTWESKVVSVKKRTLNNHMWIDSKHLGADDPNYMNRYLATVANNLSILVNLSAHKKYSDKYDKAFDYIINSVSLKQPPVIKANPAVQSDGSLIAPVTTADMQRISSMTTNKKFIYSIVFAFILVTIAFFFLVRRR